MSDRPLAEIACIVDQSGSMQNVRAAAIEGFNEFLRDQRREDGEARLSVTLFNSELEALHDGVPLADVPKLDVSTYDPEGKTALLDAMGRTIRDLRKRLDDASDDGEPDQVIVVILTDGRENASETYTTETVAHMIETQREEADWTFVFLAANIDAFEVAERYNIDPFRVEPFETTDHSVEETYRSTSRLVSNLRQTGETGDWRQTRSGADDESDD